MARVFWGNTYKEVPNAAEVRRHEEGAKEQAFQQAFDAFLIQKFVNRAAHKRQSERIPCGKDPLRQSRALNYLITAGAASLAFVVFTTGGLGKNPAAIRIAGPTDVNVLSVPANVFDLRATARADLWEFTCSAWCDR